MHLSVEQHWPRVASHRHHISFFTTQKEPHINCSLLKPFSHTRCSTSTSSQLQVVSFVIHFTCMFVHRKSSCSSGAVLTEGWGWVGLCSTTAPIKPQRWWITEVQSLNSPAQTFTWALIYVCSLWENTNCWCWPEATCFSVWSLCKLSWTTAEGPVRRGPPCQVQTHVLGLCCPHLIFGDPANLNLSAVQTGGQ